jgi:hypothetical protein
MNGEVWNYHKVSQLLGHCIHVLAHLMRVQQFLYIIQ